MPKITYNITIAPTQDKFGLHKTETGDCVLATINSENRFVKYQQTYSGEVSQVVSIYKLEQSDSETTVITNSGNLIGTDIYQDGEPLYYKAIRTPVLNHDIYLNGVKCHQDNYFVYSNETSGSFDYYNSDTGQFVFSAFHECTPVFIWNILDNLSQYTRVDNKTYYIKKNGQKIEIVFSRPNVTVKKLREQVYHPMHMDDHCMYFAPFVFNISRSVADNQYMCEYDYSTVQPRQRAVYREYVEDKFENWKLKNRNLYPTGISVYFEQIYDYFDSFEIEINNNSVQLYMGQVDIQKVAKEYGVDIAKYNAYIQYSYLDMPELKYLIDDVVSQYSSTPGFTYSAFLYPTRISYEKHVIEYPRLFTIETGNVQLSEHRLFSQHMAGPIGYAYDGDNVMSYRDNSTSHVFKYDSSQSLISSNSVALSRFKQLQEVFETLYSLFKVSIMKRVNQFQIAKFDYVLNENPFLFNSEYRLSDVRNFSSTIWMLRGTSSRADGQTYVMDGMQFDEQVMESDGSATFYLNSIKTKKITQANGSVIYNTKAYFNSTKQLLEFFESCARDVQQYDEPKRSIDYWLAPVSMDDITQMNRFETGDFAKYYVPKSVGSDNIQKYSGQDLQRSVLDSLVLYIETQYGWQAADMTKVNMVIMNNEIVAHTDSDFEILQAKLGVLDGDLLWI